jgi:nucleoside-diphosphate-sugar epimerase
MNISQAGLIIDRDMETIVSHPLPWQDFAGTTVLISGASGFLPAYMVETLLYLNRNVLERPAHIVALVRNEARARARFARYEGREDLRFLVQDVAQPLSERLECNYIVHAASQASPVYYKTDPVGTLSANVMGTFHLLNAARAGNCRGFLFFSSGDVYGQLAPDVNWVNEEMGGFVDPLNVRSCYGESKRIGETMCACWAHQYGIPTRIVRPSHTYGPGMRLDDGRVFADFVRDILSGGPIVLNSDGSARRCFCYLADAATAFFTVLLKGQTAQAYNVANVDQECSIANLADRLAVVFKNDGITIERRASNNANYVPSPYAGARPSIDKLKAMGWNPRVSIEEGFLRTVESYRGSR